MHHNEPRPDRQPEVQCVKTVKKESGDTDEMMQQVTAEPETSEDKPAADADESDAESEKGHKDICSPRVSVCLSFCWAALPAAEQKLLHYKCFLSLNELEEMHMMIVENGFAFMTRCHVMIHFSWLSDAPL